MPKTVFSVSGVFTDPLPGLFGSLSPTFYVPLPHLTTNGYFWVLLDGQDRLDESYLYSPSRHPNGLYVSNDARNYGLVYHPDPLPTINSWSFQTALDLSLQNLKGLWVTVVHPQIDPWGNANGVPDHWTFSLIDPDATGD